MSKLVTTHQPLLVNAEERARRAPKTFKLPPERSFVSMRIGSLVKLCLHKHVEGEVRVVNGRRQRDDITGERFYVEITDLGQPDGVIVGRVSNHLVTDKTLRFGDLVKFCKANIHEIHNFKRSAKAKAA
jgi:hypothetical protein